jgi:GNAT superfamily N-acetyltransferase
VIFTSGAYELDDDAGRIDADAVWEFMTTEAYWNGSRTRAQFAAQLAAAWRVVGVYETASGRQVGFARAFSDGVSIAFLSDVYVLREARGAGLGKELVETMIERGPGADFRWGLHTSDAHELYRKYGFTEPNSRYMELPSARDRQRR